MSAIINADGTVRQLNLKAAPAEVVTEEHVQDPKRLALLLTRILEAQSKFERRWAPRYLDFRDVISTGTDAIPVVKKLTHNFNAPVVWWATRITLCGAVVKPQLMEDHINSTLNTLWIEVYFPATLTIRVQEAG